LIGKKWTTLFTDEDSAEMTAFKVFKNNERPDLSHRLCIWHKRRNFERNLKKIVHTKKALASAMQLFHVISTSPNEIHVHQAICKLSALFPEFIPYIETEITPLLPLFTEAFREDAFTLDYSTTSPSESANHMIKSFLPIKINNLQQIREGISKCFLIKQQGRIEKYKKRFKNDHILTEKHGILLSPVNFSRIDESKDEAKKWEITPDNPSDDTFFACKNETRWSLDPHQCQCNEMTRTGMPCPHLVALYDKYTKDFPVKMISPRWIVNLDEITIPDLPELSLLDNDFRIHQAHDQGSDSPIEEENEEEIHESSKMTIKADSILQSDKYHSLLYLGKEIAKHGSHTVDTLQIKHDLEEILDKLMISHDDNLNQVSEIQEAGARRRGRPRKHGFSKSFMPKLDKNGNKCPLCKKSHEFSRCPNYKIFK
jgi:hypothetical protein